MAIKDPPPLAAVVPDRYRFSRGDYHAMVEVGVLHDDTRVELIRGEVLAMAAINTRHASTVDRLTLKLMEGVARRAIVRVQGPFAIGDDSEPEPDLILIRPRADFYATEHPQPKDLFLVVEVADTSLRYDHEIKVALYAEAGIVEVWLANLVDNVLEVYRDPGPKGYRSLQRLSSGDQISPLAFPDLVLPVAELLPQSD